MTGKFYSISIEIRFCCEAYFVRSYNLLVAVVSSVIFNAASRVHESACILLSFLAALCIYEYSSLINTYFSIVILAAAKAQYIIKIITDFFDSPDISNWKLK